MLIRVTGHKKNNNQLIDKMIAIDGLEDKIFFITKRRKSPYVYGPEAIPGVQLNDEVKLFRDGVEGDITENIPSEIRARFSTGFRMDVEITPAEKGMPWVYDFKICNGVRIDVLTPSGEAVWKEIERILDFSIPRDKKVSEPAIVGDMRDWKLRVDDVPYINLNEYKTVTASIGTSGNGVHSMTISPEPETVTAVNPVSPVSIEPPKEVQTLTCDICSKSFNGKARLRMHKLGAHVRPARKKLQEEAKV